MTTITTPERRTAERRVSAAVGEFAIQECARLGEELKEARAQSKEDHAAMLAALGESIRLREVNASLISTISRIEIAEPDGVLIMRASENKLGINNEALAYIDKLHADINEMHAAAAIAKAAQP